MFCPKCGNKVKDDSKFCHQCGMKMSNQETISSTQNIRKDTVNLAIEYNDACFALRMTPLARIICVISLIVAILLFNILPKLIGIIILVSAIVELVRTNRQISNTRNRLVERELKCLQNIIDDIIADPVIEYDENEHKANLTEAYRAKLNMFIMFDIISIIMLGLTIIAIIMTIVWQPEFSPVAWLVALLFIWVPITVFLIRKTARIIKGKSSVQSGLKIRSDGMIDASVIQLNAIKRCNERLHHM